MPKTTIVVRGLLKRMGSWFPVLLSLLSLVAIGYVYSLNQQLSADVAGTLAQAEMLIDDARAVQAAAPRQGAGVVMGTGEFSVPVDAPRIIYIDETPYSVHTDIHDWMLLNYESKGFKAEIVSYIQYQGLFLVSVVGQTGDSTAELWVVPYVWDVVLEDYVRGEPWMYFDSDVVGDYTERQLESEEE